MKTTRKPLDYYLSLYYPFQVTTERDDPGYFIVFPDLPDCMTQCDTAEEIGPMAEDVRRLWIETEYERGNDIPEPTYYEDYSGKFNVRMPHTLHFQLAASAERENVSLNQYVLTLLARGDAQTQLERKVDALAARLERMDAALRYNVEGVRPARNEKPQTRAAIVHLVAA